MLDPKIVSPWKKTSCSSELVAAQEKKSRRSFEFPLSILKFLRHMFRFAWWKEKPTRWLRACRTFLLLRYPFGRRRYPLVCSLSLSVLAGLELLFLRLFVCGSASILSSSFRIVFYPHGKSEPTNNRTIKSCMLYIRIHLSLAESRLEAFSLLSLTKRAFNTIPKLGGGTFFVLFFFTVNLSLYGSSSGVYLKFHPEPGGRFDPAASISYHRHGPSQYARRKKGKRRRGPLALYYCITTILLLWQHIV